MCILESAIPSKKSGNNHQSPLSIVRHLGLTHWGEGTYSGLRLGISSHNGNVGGHTRVGSTKIKEQVTLVLNVKTGLFGTPG